METVYLRGKRVRLDPARSLGQGGEADVFDLKDGRALKVFKSADHPDYVGLPEEQSAAEERIERHQRKLREFPAGLPRQVVVPEELATDRSGRRVLGYAMALVSPAEPLFRYADPAFRRAGVSTARVVQLFRGIHRVLSDLHARGVVVGDFNDMNVLVTTGNEARFIDADSFQFGGHPCTVFTERFVDPLLCDAALSFLRLARPCCESADWYAFSALLMQSLLFVGPYGGVYRPKEPTRRMPHNTRPLHRITVFHPEVQYPKPAVPYRVLPDDLLQHFHRTFERDERGPFSPELLADLQFAACPHCAVEHARTACPLCSPSATGRAEEVITVRGRVTCERRFRTSGVLLHAGVDHQALRFLCHQEGVYLREDGRVLFRGELDPALRFSILGETTLVGRGGELIALSPDRDPVRLTVDSDGTGPAFASNSRHRYWVQDGRLLRDAVTPYAAEPASEHIGDVLAGQTRIFVGPTFGLGLYRAGNLSVAFTFDAERRGINDTLRLPRLRGHLVEAACVLDEGRAFLLLALARGGTTRHLCLAYSRVGALEATAEAEAGEGSWLGTLRGKCATQGLLLAATDSGVVRVEVRRGVLEPTREFPDTEPFVDSACDLLVGQQGLIVVGRREIAVLKMT